MRQVIAFSPSIIVSATLALSAGFTATTYAAEEAQKIERIEVTGSRIKRTDMEGPSPVQSIGREDIENKIWAMTTFNNYSKECRSQVAVLSLHVVTTKIQPPMALLLLVYEA